MTEWKTTVCLAASWKKGGTCIAGKEYTGGGFGPWVRPVSERTDEALNNREFTKNNGYLTQVLDVVEIATKEPKPYLHQMENVLIDRHVRWRSLGRLKPTDLQTAVDRQIPTLWQNGFSSRGGENDRVPETALGNDITSSLLLIEPANGKVTVYKKDDYYGTKSKWRADFNYKSVKYNFAMTDLLISRLFKGSSSLQLNQALLCISLGEIFRGYAYKLVASIIWPEREG